MFGVFSMFYWACVAKRSHQIEIDFYSLISISILWSFLGSRIWNCAFMVFRIWKQLRPCSGSTINSLSFVIWNLNLGFWIWNWIWNWTWNWIYLWSLDEVIYKKVPLNTGHHFINEIRFICFSLTNLFSLRMWNSNGIVI